MIKALLLNACGWWPITSPSLESVVSCQPRSADNDSHKGRQKKKSRLISRLFRIGQAVSKGISKGTLRSRDTSAVIWGRCVIP